MAFSYYTYTGDGSTTQFPVAFGYIRREHVLATVAGAPATFTFVNSTTIQMTTAPANGAVVRVYRQTPLTAPLVDFADGSTLVAADLDTNAKQSIYTQQELDDSLVDGLAGVIPNGDKGDITTSVNGSVWTIDTGAVVEAKIGTGAVSAGKIAAGAFTDSVSSTSTTTIATPNSVKTVYDAALLKAGGTMTGNLVVPSVNGGPLAGLRNRIINGDFDIWQRGTSFTNSEYSADRWISGRVGTTHTATRQAFTPGQADVPNNPTYYIRTVVSSVAGASNNDYLTQLIEGVRTFAGQQVSISFWAKVDSTKNISVELTQSFGSGSNSPSSPVNAIGVTKVSIGTTWQKVTVTANVPSISGKTIGDTGNDYLGLFIWFDAGSSLNSRTDTLGQQSGTFEIAQVQVEPGPVATPFEQRPPAQELSLCQRYYRKVTVSAGGYSEANGAYFSVEGMEDMRAAPTFTQIATYGFNWFNNSSGTWVTAGSGITFSIVTTVSFNRLIRTQGLTGNTTTIPTPATGLFYGFLSAEL